MHWKGEGIILKKYDFRESGNFFSLLLPDKKVEAVALGTKKMQSKLGGHLLYFSLLDLMLAPGKNFYHLAFARQKKVFSYLLANEERINWGFYGLDILDRLSQVNQPEERVFLLTKKWLALLDNPAYAPWPTTLGYVWKLLSFLGYQPRFTVDFRSLPAEKKLFFNPAKGTISSSFSGKEMPLPYAAGRFLWLVFFSSFFAAEIFSFSPAVLKEVQNALDKFLLFRLEREIKSRDFLFKK